MKLKLTNKTCDSTVVHNMVTWKFVMAEFRKNNGLPVDENVLVHAARNHKKGPGKDFIKYCIKSDWLKEA